MNYLFFTLTGYLSGSVLYAYWLPKLLCGKNVIEISNDNNPGTANAYKSSGVFIGTLVLFCELSKGFLPVYFAAKHAAVESMLFIPVVLAPVLGHAFPIFDYKKGGKAIAVSFGVLLGLFPICRPVLILAAAYLSYSLVIVIEPHIFRSVVTFFTFSVLNFLTCSLPSLCFSGIAISAVVIFKHLEKYQGETFSMRLFRPRHP